MLYLDSNVLYLEILSLRLILDVQHRSLEIQNLLLQYLGAVKAFRAMRALRPLRTITRFSSLRSVVVCFMEAVPLLLSVALLLVFVIFLFSIAALQLF